MPGYILARKKNIRMLSNNHRDDVILNNYQGLHFEHNSKGQEPLIAILIIGESLRSDKLGINGYKRDTTPRMKNIDNLFSFTDMLSCSTTTSVSLPCMLTNESLNGWSERFSQGKYIPKPSVAQIFTDLYFDTKWMSAANKDYSIYINNDFPGVNTIIMSNDLRKNHISKENDFGDIILAKALNADVENNTLYVLGTMGSHRDYVTRYVERFSKYKPDRGNSITHINNAYDNTVFYFDYFIGEIIKKLKTKNAILMYTSDHGQSLGENGIFLHGADFKTAPKEQINVPFIVWTSDKFIKYNPEKVERIKYHLSINKEENYKLTHDYIFHSLLSCSGIHSNNGGIDKSLSICD